VIAVTSGKKSKAASFNLAAIKGEPGTGFEKAGTLGEFECGNCSFFENQGCYQKDMKGKSKEPRNKDGSVEVAEEDCCEYVDRVGRKDEEEEG
jgi:hypothetical protein